MKDLTKDELVKTLNSSAIEGVSHLAEAGALLEIGAKRANDKLAEGIDWAALVAEAMDCRPMPLFEAMRQIHFKRGLYPPALKEFLTLMAENQSKRGRPRKDDVARQAAKAWRDLIVLRACGVDPIRDFLRRAKAVDKSKTQHATLEVEPGKVRMSVINKSGPKLRIGYYATREALEVMAEA